MMDLLDFLPMVLLTDRKILILPGAFFPRNFIEKAVVEPTVVIRAKCHMCQRKGFFFISGNLQNFVPTKNDFTIDSKILCTVTV